MKLICLSILLLITTLLKSQIPIFGWRSHASMNAVASIAENGELIFAATANSIFSLNAKDGEIKTYTKGKGLSDINISAMAISKESGFLVVGYGNGNIDLISSLVTFNIPDIKRSSLSYSKKINRIICDGSFAYLCCNFGIVKLNLTRTEISETWLIGPLGSTLAVFDLVIENQNLWVATEKGIYQADRNALQLRDYRNWHPEISLVEPTNSYCSVASSGGSIFVLEEFSHKIWKKRGLQWEQVYPEFKNTKRLLSNSAGLVLLTSESIWYTQKGTFLSINKYKFDNNLYPPIQPSDLLFSENGHLWIGDLQYGLTEQVALQNFQHYTPNSPSDDRSTKLTSINNTIYAVTGIEGSFDLSAALLHSYSSGQWSSFNPMNVDKTTNSLFLQLTSDHKNQEILWVASEKSGLFALEKNLITKHFDQYNSSLGAVNNLCKVSGLAFDQENLLWYTNPTGKDQIGVMKNDGSWHSVRYPGMEQGISIAGSIAVTKSGVKWVILPNEGFFVFQNRGVIENVVDDNYKKINVWSKFSNGSTTILQNYDKINCVVEDLNQQLWVGTNSGVVCYLHPEKVFTSEDFYGIQPSLENSDGYFKPILDKESVTAIAIDPGNRKWIGTVNSGVFLFSEEGSRMIAHYDETNSPLPSNHLLSIAINEKNGEVFFATTLGIVSYKSDASSNSENFHDVYVWPNPLRETFSGNVTVDGLIDNTIVKITDLSGTLIYQTASVGGRAIWNGEKQNGGRVSTGVYLIFCSNIESKLSKVIKLLVIK